MKYVVLFLTLICSHYSFATGTCGSGSSFAVLEQSLSLSFTQSVNNATIKDTDRIFGSVKWNWASLSHPVTRWILDVSLDSSPSPMTTTGVRLSVDNFSMSIPSIGPFSVGSHKIRTTVRFENGQTCWDEASFNVIHVNPSEPVRVGKLQHIGGLCLQSVTNGSNSLGSIVLGSCANAPILTLRADGNIQRNVDGACIHPNGGSPNPANDTQAVWYPSCGEERLRFTYLPSGSLQHVSSGKCLHPYGGSAAPAAGTKVVFWGSCNETRLKFNFL